MYLAFTPCTSTHVKRVLYNVVYLLKLYTHSYFCLQSGHFLGPLRVITMIFHFSFSLAAFLCNKMLVNANGKFLKRVYYKYDSRL